MPGPHGYEHDWIYVGGAGLPSKTAMAKRPHVTGGGNKIRAAGHAGEKPNRRDRVATPHGEGVVSLVTPSKVTVKLDNPGGGPKYRQYNHEDVGLISRDMTPAERRKQDPLRAEIAKQQAARAARRRT